MSQFSRTINISAETLCDTDTSLLLIFDEQPMPSIYKNYFPVVWKVHTFPVTGHSWVSLTYKNQLVFSNTQIENNDVICGTWGDVKPGQQTDLIENPKTGRITFTAPKPGAGPQYIKANNETKSAQDIGVGFINGGSPPPTLLLFQDIHAMQNVTAQFVPILRAYITKRYREQEVIRQEIGVPVWRQDLATLEETSNWKLQYNPVTKTYSMTEA